MAQNRKSMKIKTKPAWCKGCKICVSFCPKQCLGLDANDKIRMIREEDCIKCALCEDLCPDYAIFLVNNEEN